MVEEKNDSKRIGLDDIDYVMDCVIDYETNFNKRR